MTKLIVAFRNFVNPPKTVLTVNADLSFFISQQQLIMELRSFQPPTLQSVRYMVSLG